MLRNLGRLLLALALSQFSFAALAHDVWINRGAYKNPAGEWCCGAEDCGVVAPGAVKAGVGGYSVRGPVTYGVGRDRQCRGRADAPGKRQRGRAL